MHGIRVVLISFPKACMYACSHENLNQDATGLAGTMVKVLTAFGIRAIVTVFAL